MILLRSAREFDYQLDNDGFLLIVAGRFKLGAENGT